MNPPSGQHSRPSQSGVRKGPTTARTTPTKRLSAESTPGRYTRYQPKRKSVLRRIVNWLIFLTIVGLPIASFFVKTPEGPTYADAYVKPAWRWAKAKLQPVPAEGEPAKTAEKSELDKRFEAVLAARGKAQEYFQSLAQAGEDKAADIAAEIEKQIDGLGNDFGAVTTEISAEMKKPRPQRKTALDAPSLNQEFAAFAKFYREAAGHLGKWKDAAARAAAKKAAEEKPKVVEAAIVAYDLRKVHAWASRKPETWVRWKTAAGLEDHVLRTLTDEGAVVRVVAHADGKSAEQPDRLFAFGFARVVREEPVKVGDTEIPCRVVESGGTLRWIPKEGRWADRLAVKTSTGGTETALSAVAEEEIPVKGQPTKCLKFEVEGAKYWGLEEAPGFLVRIEDARGVSEAIAWGEELAARPELPAPPKPPEPAPAAGPSRPHPWAAFKPGVWARRKTLFDSPTSKNETGADTILLEVGATHIVQRIETLGPDGGLLSVERKVPLAPGEEKMISLEALTVGDKSHSCQVVEVTTEAGVQRLWIPVDGRLAALCAPLKVEGANTSKTAVEIGERQVPVAGRDLPCVSIAYVGKTIDGPVKELLLLSEDVPGFEVLRESVAQSPLGENRMTFRLVDFGSDPARKTSLGVLAEDAASVERRKIERALNESESKVIHASRLFRELTEATKALPAETDALQALIGKHDQAAKLFAEAKEGYASVKDRAPESAKVDEKIVKLDRAVEVLGKYGREIRAKLK